MTKPLDEATRQRIDAFVSEWIADADVPGAGLTLVDADGVLHATGYGARNLQAGEPATPDTMFGIGSCSKSITALAILQLAEQDALTLDEEVSEYVPRFEDSGVTLADLLTHTSGMPSDGLAVAAIARRTGAAPATAPTTSRDDFDRLIEGTEDDRVTDRETFFYYNSGYTILSDVVAAVAGQPFREYVQTNIFSPLGMDRATYRESAFEGDDNAATPYYRDPGARTDANSDGETGGDSEESSTLTEGGFPFGDRMDGPGGLVASATTLGRYVRAQIRGGELDGARVIDADRLATAHEAHATRQRYLDGAEQGYGYGWMRQPFGVGGRAGNSELDRPADTLVGHGGSVSVATAYLGWLEEAGIGVALTCNTSADPHPMQVGPAVLALATGREPEATVPGYALDAKLDPLVGTYESIHDIMRATVKREGGTLAIEMETDLGDQTMHVAPDSFATDDLTFHTVSAAGAEVPVRFERDDSGVVTDLFVQRWRLQKE